MMVLVLLVFFATAVAKARLWRLSLVGSSAVLFLMGVRLARDTESVWRDGTGILRGIRMGFGGFPECGGIAAWEPLGLFLVAWLFVTSAFMDRENTPSREVLIALFTFGGLVLSNSMHVVMVCWSLLVAIAIWSSFKETTLSLGRSISPGIAALCVGVVFCSAIAYADFDRLIGTHGSAGLLDMGGLARLRHLRLGSPFAHGPQIVSILPLILAVASVSAALMFDLSRPLLCTIGSSMGAALILKIYPLAELGIRDATGTGVLLILSGMFVMVWAGLRTTPHRRRLSLVCCGGTMALLGAKMPIGAVAWVLLWAPVIAARHSRLNRASVIAGLGSLVVLAPFWQWIGTHGAFLTAFAALATISVGLVIPMTRERKWWKRGYVSGVVPLLLCLPPISTFFWFFWTGKIRIAAASTLTPWFATTFAAAVGLLIQWKGQRLLLRGVTCQIDRLAQRMNRTMSVWIGPVIDTLSVMWVAGERFLWQGLTLWLPRRVLRWVAIHVDWLQRVPLPSFRRIPLDVVSWGAGFFAHAMTTSPRATVVLLTLFVIAVWAFGGIIP